jgi:membrane carboxypeptidase/penicillin-binding protein
VAAGKTGTTSDGRDVWFAGYTPDLVGVIWMGLDRPATILPSAAGGQLGAPVWGRVMARAYRERPAPEPWPMPAGVRRLRADPTSGIVIADWCALSTANARTEVFLAEHVPPSGCPIPPRRSFFDRTFGWFDDLFGDRRDEDEEREERVERARENAREARERRREREERAREEAEEAREERDEEEERPRRLRIRIRDDLSRSGGGEGR